MPVVIKTVRYDQIHDASINFNNDGQKYYRFELCDGKVFEFALPVLIHECEGVKNGIH